MRLLSILSIISILITLFFFSIPSYAACDATMSQSAGSFLKDCAYGSVNAVSPAQGGDSVTSIRALVSNIAKKVIGFGALFAIGAIVFSGIQYTSSFGDDEKVKKAKTTGIYAIIGLLILLVSFPMVDTVVNFVYAIGG